MKSSQQAFSDLGIAYPQVQSGQQPQQVYNDVMGVILLSYSAIKAGTYKSPATLPVPTSLPGLVPMEGQTMEQAIAQMVGDPQGTNSFGPAMDGLTGAWQQYLKDCTTGNLATVHGDVDAMNAIIVNLLPTSQPVFVPRSDIDILRTTPGIIGQVSQQSVDYFPYGADPVTDMLIQSILTTGNAPASMQPTVFLA